MTCPVCKSYSFVIIKNIHKTPSSILSRLVLDNNGEFDLKVCGDCVSLLLILSSSTISIFEWHRKWILLKHLSINV